MDDAKLFVCAFLASNFTVVDPMDRHMFDFPGLDSSRVQVMADIVSKRFCFGCD